ncbi:myosin light chain kinase 3 isoform X2 [Tachyglossus aculeatus]|uniref:myosin light chain kinase 3 isoform X2 n=1 Tax=Tachyglossus aculeatus TaxID=9261 RepID=UPI0018F359C7|nr:myosin light chain kinase 3 isoform X2 [Tachyglossus aculeatus]
MSAATQEPTGLPRGSPVVGGTPLNTMDTKLNLLNEKVDKLLTFQEDVTEKLESVYRGIGDLERGIYKLTVSQAALDQRGLRADASTGCPEILELVKSVRQDSLEHGTKLDGLARMVTAVDRAIALVAATFQNSKIVDFIVHGLVPWRKGGLMDGPEETKDKAEEKEGKAKHALSTRGVQAEIRRSPEGDKGEHPPPDPGAADGEGTSQEETRETPTAPARAPNCPQLPAEEADSEDEREPSQRPVPQPGVAGEPDDDPDGRDAGDEADPGRAAPERTTSSDKEAAQLEPGPNPRPTPSSLPPGTGAGRGGALPRISICVQETATPGEMLVTRGENRGPSAGQILPPRLPSPPVLAGESVRHRQGLTPHRPCLPLPRTAQAVANGKRGTSLMEQAPLGGPGSPPLEKKLPPACTQTGETPGSEADPSPAGKGGERGASWGPVKRGEEPGTAASEPGKDRQAGSATSRAGPAGETETEPSRTPGRTQESMAAAGGDPAAGSGSSVVVDDSPPPPAPFKHRIVSVKEAAITVGYSVCQHEVLGGGRFGQVHKCTEKSSGLTLAAKIIKVKTAKDREEVKNEINIMNQLSHVNLIQLYDAFESKNSFTLVMEYVDGGELFDRITDEKYHLTELDVILFTRQICEGIHYLHQQYILHLDLKPENILCVNRTGNQIKIIDFGLARRLSGLSPFLGETDAETMNFIVNCSWDFDGEAFEGLSEEAKDFVSRLLVKEKSCRTSATQCLKHDWLNNLTSKATKSKIRLKSQLLLQKYLAQRKWKKHFYVVAAANRLKKFPTSP